MARRASIVANKVIELPEWIFDVDEDDEEKENISLLEELDIDLNAIYKSVAWMFLGPCQRVFRIKTSERHPLTLIDRTNSSKSIDFWGPYAVVSAYVALLWLGSVRNGNWAFIIWTIPSVMNHFIMRACTKSKFFHHMAIIGYSLAPMIPFAAVIIIFHPPIWVATILETIAVLWASFAAVLSYIASFIVPPEQKHRLSLLLPSIILTELYFISLVPVRFYVYHKHQALSHFPSGAPTSMPSIIKAST